MVEYEKYHIFFIFLFCFEFLFHTFAVNYVIKHMRLDLTAILFIILLGIQDEVRMLFG